MSAINRHDHPCIVLSGGSMHVTVCTPDPDFGYYRGARFDWSGMIGRVEYRDHVFFGDWLTPHDALHPEHGIGPAEEFDMDAAQGFSEAQPGESFLKIGVGEITKVVPPEEYVMKFAYPIALPAPWRVSHGGRWIEFSQQCVLGTRGYCYTKRIELDKRNPVITIAHRLSNTQGSVLSTEHYNHSFTMIDDTLIGPDYRVVFPFTPIVSGQTIGNFAGYARFDNNTLTFLAPLGDKELWTPLSAPAGSALINGFTVKHAGTNAAVEVCGNRVPSKFNFYAAGRAICPEPFVSITLNPGETFLWTTTFTFRAGSRSG